MNISARILATSIFLGIGAVAAPPEPIRVALPDCKTPPIDPSSLKQAMLLELQGAGFVLASASHTRVVVETPDCRPDPGALVLTIEFRLESGTDASLHTRVPLADVPEASRARTVALAAAELLRVARQMPFPESASARHGPWTSPPVPAPITTSLRDSGPTPVPSPTTPPASDSNRLTRRFPSLGLAAGTQVAWLIPRDSAFVGGQLEAQLALSRRWRPRTGLALAWNSVNSGYGSIDLTAVIARLGWDALIVERPTLALGPEVALVTVTALGQSRLGVSESTQTLRYYTGGLRLGLEVPIYGALWLMVNASAGLALNSVVFTAGGENAAQFAGLQGAWGAGILLQP